MRRYTVKAFARQHGAIGVFGEPGTHEGRRTVSPLTFIVEAAGPLTEEQAKDAWFAHHGKEWELHHFVNVAELFETAV